MIKTLGCFQWFSCGIFAEIFWHVCKISPKLHEIIQHVSILGVLVFSGASLARLILLGERLIGLDCDEGIEQF